MRRQLRKTFLTTTLICFLALGSFASAKSDLIAFKSIPPQEVQQFQDVRVNDLDIEPINTQEVKKNVVPDTKSEGKKVIAYFLRAMLGVAFCAIVLYLILVFIKKYYGSAFVNLDEEEYFEAFDLSTPKTKQDALKAFLNRTK